MIATRWRSSAEGPHHRRLDRRNVGHDGDIGIPHDAAESVARIAHTAVELGKRLTAARHVVDILLPVVPRLRRCVGDGDSLEDPIAQLDPPLVRLERDSERVGSLCRSSQRTADQQIDGADVLGDDGGLLAADIIERLVDSPLQTACGVEGGAPVANQDQHALSEPRIWWRACRRSSSVLEQSAGAGDGAPPGRGSETCPPPHPHDDRQTDRLERDIPPAALHRWKRLVANRGAGEGPPEHLGGRPRPIEHEMEERADRQPEQQLAARLAPHAGRHHDGEQSDAEQQRVHPPHAAKETVEVGQQCADDQQAVVEARVTEHVPDRDHGRTDEPQEHPRRRRRLGDQHAPALRAVGVLPRRCCLHR